MPSLSSIRTSNKASFSSLSASGSNSLPVAVFVGGTSGIGQATAEAFSRYTNGAAHIIIVGRNRAAGEAIIASFPKDPRSKYEFVECDVSLISNVRAVTKELLGALPKLNYLVTSAGGLASYSKQQTPEGLDGTLALTYHSRWKFIHDLLPLLKKAREEGENARVLTVLAAGEGGAITPGDWEVTEKYSMGKAMGAGGTYNDLMVESFAERNPDIAFTHIYPGLVNTNVLKPNHWALKLLYPFLSIIMYFTFMTQGDSAEVMLYALLQGEKGSFRRGQAGDLLPEGKGYFGNEEARKGLWEYTEGVTRGE